MSERAGMQYVKPQLFDYGDLRDLTESQGWYGYEDAGSKDEKGRFQGPNVPPGSAIAP